MFFAWNPRNKLFSNGGLAKTGLWYILKKQVKKREKIVGFLVANKSKKAKK